MQHDFNIYSYHELILKLEYCNVSISLMFYYLLFIFYYKDVIFILGGYTARKSNYASTF